MRSWNDWKEIKNTVKEKLDSKGFPFGGLDMAYDEEYVDFMLSSSGNDVFVRVDIADQEKLMLVIDNDASDKRKNRVEEILNHRDFFKSTMQADAEINESKFDKKIVLSSVNGLDNLYLASEVAKTLETLWPYIEGVAKISETESTDEIDATVEDLEDNESDNDFPPEESELEEETTDTEEDEEAVEENDEDVAEVTPELVEAVEEKISEDEEIVVEHEELEETPTENNKEATTIEGATEEEESEELVSEEETATENPAEEFITEEPAMEDSDSVENPVAEEVVEEIANTETDESEKPSEPVFVETTDFGNVYINENVPERNGRTRLIKQRIGDTSLQLYFLLPDEEEHFVQIESQDSTGVLDYVDARCRNQFRFFAFPKSPEQTIYVKVLLDGEYAYGRRFNMPNHLRTTKKAEIIYRPEIEEKVEEVVEEKTDETAKEEKVEPVTYIDLDMEIDTTEISKMATKVFKGE